MSKKSQRELLNQNKLKNELVWGCIRLNKWWRGYSDAYTAGDWAKVRRIQNKAPDFISNFIGTAEFHPDYRYRDLKTALGKGMSGTNKTALEQIYKSWLNKGFHNDPDDLRVKTTILRKKDGDLPQCQITFTPKTNRDKLLNAINTAFFEFELASMKHRGNAKKLYKAYFDALETYEKHTFKKISVKKIASQLNAEKYGPQEAENKVRDQLKTAKRLIEKGGFEKFL